jgi:hypothetical protein
VNDSYNLTTDERLKTMNAPTTQDDLLARHLDGTLSAADRTEFDYLLANDATFAQEVHELGAIESLLGASQQQQDVLLSQASTFLSGVENHIATVIAGTSAVAGAAAIAAASNVAGLGTGTGVSAGVGTSVGAGAGAATGAATGTGIATSTGIFASLSSAVTSVVGGSWAILAGTAAAVTGAAAVYYVSTAPAPRPTSTSTSNKTKTTTSSPADRTAQPAPEPFATSETSSKAAKETISATKPRNEASTPETRVETRPETRADDSTPALSPSSAYSARIAPGTAAYKKYTTLIADYERKLAATEAQGDRAGAALLAKSLGTFHRELGNMNDARIHLQRSLNDARALGITELEGESLGELALVDAAQGKYASAQNRLRSATTILYATKGNSADRWNDELRRVEKLERVRQQERQRKSSKKSSQNESDGKSLTEPRFRAK